MSKQDGKPTAADLLAQVNKALGHEVMVMGNDPRLEVRVLPTGVMPFDWLLGGGLPTGRIIELYGDYSTLKSYIALKAMATTMEAGGTVALVDTEKAYDPAWAESLGVDIAEVIMIYPDTGEEGIAAAEVCLRNNVDLLVWDSVAATLPMAEHEKAPTEDKQPARQAQMMSRGLRRLVSANRNTSMLFINQTRVNVGMTFGSPTVTPGGKSLPFYASQRVQLTRAGRVTEDTKVWDGDKEVGGKRTTAYKIKMQLLKSKLNKPYQESWFWFDLETAEVDTAGWLMAWGLDTGVIIRPNAQVWEIPALGVSARGKKNMHTLIREDADVYAFLVGEALG